MEAKKEAWEGSIALATKLDWMLREGNRISKVEFLSSLDSLGLGGETVIAGLLATGLVALVGEELELTQRGGQCVIHAFCSL